MTPKRTDAEYSPEEQQYLDTIVRFGKQIRNLRNVINRAELRDNADHTSTLILECRIQHRYSTEIEEVVLDVGDEYQREELRLLADYINEIIDQSQWDDSEPSLPTYVGEEFDREFESLGNVCRSSFFRGAFNIYKRYQYRG